jgi:hypothetical protein
MTHLPSSSINESADEQRQRWLYTDGQRDNQGLQIKTKKKTRKKEMPREYSVFVCLMASYSHDGVMRLKVCRASNLAKNLSRHNRKERCLDPSTRKGAPYWEYVMVIGPFQQDHKALATKWTKKAESRKGEALYSFIRTGLELGLEASRVHKRPMLYTANASKFEEQQHKGSEKIDKDHT